ncbi:MAG: anti-sigma factor RsbA family regulatory protein [Jatrophihabitans sp.]
MADIYRHEALPYSGEVHFVAACTGVVRDALEQDERPLVLAGFDKVDAVRAALGADADEVTFVATDEHGRNPGRITTMLHRFATDAKGQRCVGVNEPVFAGRFPTAIDEVVLAEFLLNEQGLRTLPLSIVCMYDDGALDSPVMDSMRQSHPVVRGQDANPEYRLGRGRALYETDLGAAPPGARRLVVGTHGLDDMRGFVGTIAAGFGIAADRVADLVLAANEIVTNSLRYGGGRARLATWFADGSAICEVRDDGHISDPLVGRFAPPSNASGGRGLWLANHLCDLVQLRSFRGGTVVRLHVDR